MKTWATGNREELLELRDADAHLFGYPIWECGTLRRYDVIENAGQFFFPIDDDLLSRRGELPQHLDALLDDVVDREQNEDDRVVKDD